eukprot:20572-Heterococcus_DN1.PRE.1
MAQQEAHGWLPHNGDEADGDETYFTPLWKTKVNQSFAGGALHAPLKLNAAEVESEGFQPLRKARSEAAAVINTRFSFNSRAAQIAASCAVLLQLDCRTTMQQCGRSVIPGACSKRICLLQPQDWTQFLAESCSVTDTYLLRVLAYQRCVPMQLKCRRRSVVITDTVLHFTHNAIMAIVLLGTCHRPMPVAIHTEMSLIGTSSYHCAYTSAISYMEGLVLEFDATFQYDDRSQDSAAAIAELVHQLQQLPWEVSAVIAGAETGVELSDVLSARMGVLSNGEELSLARRNKYLMGEQVRKSTRAVQQKMATTWEDIELFLQEWNPNPLQSVDEVRQAFDTINGKVNGLGSVNEGALVQEYLDGTEYVIDSVSRDGVHKVVAIWEYDKRSVNGANFVYFGMKLNAASGEKEQQLCDYALTVLDAMGVVHGPGHMEVKVHFSNLTGRVVRMQHCALRGQAPGIYSSVARSTYLSTNAKVALTSYMQQLRGEKYVALLGALAVSVFKSKLCYHSGGCLCVYCDTAVHHKLYFRLAASTAFMHSNYRQCTSCCRVDCSNG